MPTYLGSLSNACRWKLTILVVLGKTRNQKRRKKVKRESLGEGGNRAGCWLISDQMKKIILNIHNEKIRVSSWEPGLTRVAVER